MAKAQEIDGLEATTYALEGVAKVLRVRFDEVIDKREAALDFSDEKGVHDMRVAIRRLRSALRDFKPLMKKNPLKQVKIDLKNLADALGAVRDLDVEIMAIEKLKSEAKDEGISPGIEKLLQERRDLRGKAQSNLADFLEIEKIDDLRQKFTGALEKSIDSDSSDQTLSFKSFGRKVIMANLEEFSELSSALYSPFDTVQLHHLRISAKRWRYAIQMFAACRDDEMKLFAKEISRMQSLLGDTHDRDVWIDELAKRLETAENDSGFAASDRPAIIWLLSEFFDERNKEYISAVKLHNEWKINYFIPRLKAMLL